MQTILVMMLSIGDASDEFTAFASSLYWTKLDLSFILFDIQKKLGCEQPSNKMLRFGFYCQSTVHNYMILIILVVALVATIAIVRKYLLHSVVVHKIYLFLEYIWNGNILSFILIPLNISPLLFANVIMDGINIETQIILSLVSIGTLSILLLIFIFSRWRILNEAIIMRVDPTNTTCYFYLNLIRIVILSLMFTWGSALPKYCLFAFLLLAIQFIMILVQFKDHRVLTTEYFKERTIHIVFNSHLLFMMFIIWFSIVYQTENILKIWAIMIAEFYIFMIFINFTTKLIAFKNN